MPATTPVPHARTLAGHVRSGASLVIVVDPARRTVRLHDAHGVVELDGDDSNVHHALPGFSMALPDLFTAADPPTR